MTIQYVDWQDPARVLSVDHEIVCPPEMHTVVVIHNKCHTVRYIERWPHADFGGDTIIRVGLQETGHEPAELALP